MVDDGVVVMEGGVLCLCDGRVESIRGVVVALRTIGRCDHNYRFLVNHIQCSVIDIPFIICALGREEFHAVGMFLGVAPADTSETEE